MKKYLVIGNPINHSLSPKLHNYWIKKNKLNAIYNKMKINESDIKILVAEIMQEKLHGINVTVPFKKSVLPFMNELTSTAEKTQSVNTIYKNANKIIGDNTDVGGFEQALKNINYSPKGKKVLILGAGGVVSSIILTLKRMGVHEITLSNRTKSKAEEIKKVYSDIKIIDWGEISDFDMIINATILGLKSKDEIKLNFEEIGNNKLFYDVIYNPKETKFLNMAKKNLNQTENGKTMFLYQAQLAFEIWHGFKPEIDSKVIELLEND